MGRMAQWASGALPARKWIMQGMRGTGIMSRTRIAEVMGMR